jgi:hypothetical protein
MFICGGIEFDSLAMAIEYANNQYNQFGIILGIERV